MNHTAIADQLATVLRNRTRVAGHVGCDPATGLCADCTKQRQEHAARRHAARVEAVLAEQRGR